MKILFLTKEKRSPSIDTIFEAIAKKADIDVVRLSKNEQLNLSKRLQKIDLNSYDRVVLDLKFKYVSKQATVVARMPNLVIFEEDANQEFNPSAKRYKAFSKFYKKLPQFRLVVTNLQAAAEFGRLGVDTKFVSKGYDNAYLKNLGGERTIGYAYIGRVNNPIYRERVQMLEELQKILPVQMLRTSSQHGYLEKLNQIKVFVSADVGMNEYMFKNFEAMACGCLLLAYRQGHEEIIGLRDMENIVLYSSPGEAMKKMQILQDDPDLATKIAQAGQGLVESKFSFEKIAEEIFEHLQEDIQENRFYRKSFFRQLLQTS